jgi:hypothetical protein
MIPFAEIVSITAYLFAPRNPNWDPRVWYARGDKVQCLGQEGIVDHVSYITIRICWTQHSNEGVGLHLNTLMDSGAIQPSPHRLQH